MTITVTMTLAIVEDKQHLLCAQLIISYLFRDILANLGYFVMVVIVNKQMGVEIFLAEFSLDKPLLGQSPESYSYSAPEGNSSFEHVLQKIELDNFFHLVLNFGKI